MNEEDFTFYTGGGVVSYVAVGRDGLVLMLGVCDWWRTGKKSPCWDGDWWRGGKSRPCWIGEGVTSFFGMSAVKNPKTRGRSQ